MGLLGRNTGSGQGSNRDSTEGFHVVLIVNGKPSLKEWRLKKPVGEGNGTKGEEESAVGDEESIRHLQLKYKWDAGWCSFLPLDLRCMQGCDRIQAVPA